MMNLMSLFSSAPDSMSSTRTVKVFWFAAVIGVWCWVSVTTHQLADLPDSVIWVSGIVFGSSIAQKKIEQAASLPTRAMPHND